MFCVTPFDICVLPLKGAIKDTKQSEVKRKECYFPAFVLLHYKNATGCQCTGRYF